MKKIYLLQLKNFPIFKQLQLEEALLRIGNHNYCLLNEGSPESIVMGISGKADELIYTSEANAQQIPIIKRFSGGGTVFVDSNTLFTTFIANNDFVSSSNNPQAIMKWSAKLFQKVFSPSNFSLRENDYVIGNRKFGGNAQYFTKKRWLHHTSFLWDYDSRKMNLLRLPKKRPLYRGERIHDDFLCKLKNEYSSLSNVKERFISMLNKRFEVYPIELEKLSELLNTPHRKVTEVINKKKICQKGPKVLALSTR